MLPLIATVVVHTRMSCCSAHDLGDILCVA